MDSPPTGGKNLRTQIWGGKDKGLQPDAEGCMGRNFKPGSQAGNSCNRLIIRAKIVRSLF